MDVGLKLRIYYFYLYFQIMVAIGRKFTNTWTIDQRAKYDHMHRNILIKFPLPKN